MLPVPACPACRALLLETPLPECCPRCGESLGPSAEATPWSPQATPTPHGFTGLETPHGFQGLKTPIVNPWAQGATPPPLPWSIDTGDLPPTEIVEDASDWPVQDPSLYRGPYIPPLRPVVQSSSRVEPVTRESLFDDLDLTPAELLVIGVERRSTSSAPRANESRKIVVVDRSRRHAETLIRENTIGLHIDLGREVVAGAPSWVIRGLGESKANLLAAKLNAAGVRARAIAPVELEDGRSPRNRSYVLEQSLKLIAAAFLLFFLVVMLAAEHLSPLVGDWTLALRAEVVSAFEP